VATPIPSKRERLVSQLVTLALVAANLVVFNAILSPWAAARLDLTRDRAFSISPATRRLLGSLDDDLTVTGYFSKRTHPKLAPLVPQIEDLLEEYRALARRRVHVEIIDPGENDRLEQEANDRYGVTSTPFRLASKYESGIVNAYFALVIKYGDQYVRYGFDDLIEVEPLPDGDVDVRLRNLEYDLTRAIKKVVFGFRGAGQLFERLGKPVRLTAVWTPDRLPSPLAGVPAELRKAAQELEKSGRGRFAFEEIVPADAARQAEVERRFGARPLSLGLFSSERFYLQGFLSVGDHVEQVPLASARVSAAELREAIEASLKRQAPGFLKTVGVVAPGPTLPPEVLMQLRMQGQMPPQPPPEFDQLKARLRQDYQVRDVSLEGAQGVPGDVDVLLVIKPRALQDRAVYNLDQYLMRGGRLILCAGSFDPEFGQTGLAVRPADSGLDAWLKHNGVEISKTLLLDDRNQPLPIPEVRQTIFGAIRTWSLRPYPYLAEVRDAGLKHHAITAKLDAVGIYWGSPIEVLPDAAKRLRVTPILESSPRSWIDDDLQHVTRLDYAVPAGAKPHLVAAALQGSFESFFAHQASPPVEGDSSRHDVPITRSPETRLVVVGDAEFVSDLVAGALGRQSGGLYLQNLGFVQNLVDWMNLDDDLVAIRTRASAARPIRRLPRGAQITIEVANYVIPLLVLAGFGLTRYGRRRRARPLVDPGRAAVGAGGR
jgi:ABC-2 type transport system permease protein